MKSEKEILKILEEKQSLYHSSIEYLVENKINIEKIETEIEILKEILELE